MVTEEQSERMSLRLDLLDRQIVDTDRTPIGRVDDLELEPSGPGGRPQVATLLCGQVFLGDRLGGRLGSVLSRTARRLSDPGSGRPAGFRAGPAEVEEWGSLIKLRARLEELPRAAALEHWLSDNVVRRLPGSGR